MRFEVARDFLDEYSKENEKIDLKFFGGEPLLEFDLVKEILSYVKLKFREFSFEICTNGFLLTLEMLDFFERENFKFHISIDGDRITQGYKFKDAVNIIDKVPELRRDFPIVNIVLSPKNIWDSYSNFVYLYQKGFRKFKLLPHFFTNWREDEFVEFEKQLSYIFSFIKEKGIYLDNFFIKENRPLVNSGIVVDCKGVEFVDNGFLISDELVDNEVLGGMNERLDRILGSFLDELRNV